MPRGAVAWICLMGTACQMLLPYANLHVSQPMIFVRVIGINSHE